MKPKKYKVIIKGSSGLEINRKFDGSHSDLLICDDLLQEGDTIQILGLVN